MGSANAAIAARTASALVIAAIAGACLYFGRPYFHLLVALFALAMIGEWSHVACGEALPVPTVGLAMAVLAAVATLAGGGWLWSAAAIGAGGAAVVWAFGAVTRAAQPGWIALGVIYVAAPVIAMIGLLDGPGQGAWTVLWVIATVAATDLGAFFAGRAIGGPRLAPRLSPKKTWAGLLGGMALSILVSALLGAYFSNQPVLFWAIGGALLAVISQAGDLAESAFKRRFKVKDASHLIPGHGGVLDRVDGLVAAAVVVALYVWANEGLVVP